MHKFPILAAVVSLAIGTSCAFAQGSNIRYKWFDAQGLVHYSDSLTAEAMTQGYDLVNDRGITVRHVERQLTPEERAEHNRLAAEQAAVERAARDKANAEAQMLSIYPDEESYQISLQQALEGIDQQIHTTEINLRSQEKALSDLLARAAEYEDAKNPVPKVLADNITSQRNVVAQQRAALAKQQALRAETAQKQAAQLARYRELKAAKDTATH